MLDVYMFDAWCVYACKNVDKIETKRCNLIDDFLRNDIELEIDQSQEFVFECDATTYFNKLCPGNAVCFTAMVQDPINGHSAMNELPFVLEAPTEIINLYFTTDERKVGTELTCEINIKNPFDEDLHDICLTIEGQSMGSDVKTLDKLAVGEEHTFEMALKPKKVGENLLCLVDLDSREIQDIKGYYEVSISSV